MQCRRSLTIHFIDFLHTQAAEAASTAAEKYAIKGGNGGDLYGGEGVQPVMVATLEACGDCKPVRDAYEAAAQAAAGRTNARAASVADAIWVAARAFGVKQRTQNLHPITGQSRFATMHQFTRSDAKWTPEEP